MTESHQRILMDTELIIAARQGDESRFARILGLEEDNSKITINTDNRCIARDEPDFFLGVTYTGNSLLHLAASSNFLDLAKKIWRKERSLLVARNKVLETPLHCAAKNGNSEIVSFFIESAQDMGGDTMEELLRAQNKDGETALHEAVRHNHASVAYLLITADPVLASVIDHEGISPLYLATASGYEKVVYRMVRGLIGIEVSGIEVSKAYYAGPDGQTALHAAVLRSKEMTKILLRWKPLLAQMPDNSGSTPLHFAASYGYDNTVHVLLKRDHSLAYLHDKCGSFPMHAAAKMGHVGVIIEIMDHCPDSDELLDAKGRNFLHVAAQEKRGNVLELIWRNTSQHKIMKNARDNDGNTPLHLAMDSENEDVIYPLMRDKEVSVNIFNKKGLTPQDQSSIATFNDYAISPEFQKTNFWIERSMEMLGACYGAQRRDQFVKDHTTKEDVDKENVKLTSAIQTIGLGSVLIATATFAAAFTLPGSNGADYFHKSGWFSQVYKYALKAFLVSDTLAFWFAFQCTMILLFSGVTTSKPHLKKKFVASALLCLILASKWTVISLAIAAFVVLAPFNKLLGFLILFAGILFQFNAVARERRISNGVITARKGWDQLRQSKLPEDTLVQGLSAWRRDRKSLIWYAIDTWFPTVITAVSPLIMDLVWYIGKLVVTKISRHH